MRIARKYRMTALSLISGILLAVSWPEKGVPVLIFISLVPLLIMENFVLKNKEKFSKYAVLLFSWLAFITFNALTTWWIVFATFPGMLAAVLLNSLLMALPFTFMHAARRILPGNQGSVSLIIFWLSFEFLHLNWEISWPWLNLGNVFATMPRVIQWYEYTGTLGGTLWILILNILFFEMYKAFQKTVQTISVKRNLTSDEKIEEQKKEIYLANLEQFKILKRRTQVGIITLFFLLVPTIISFVMWSRFEMPDSKSTEVVIVQHSRDPYLSPASVLQEKQWTDSIIDLAETVVTENTKYIIASEAALPGYLNVDQYGSHYGFQQLKRHTKTKDSLTWISGVMMYKVYGNNDTIPATASYSKTNEYYYDVYNGAMMVTSEGDYQTYYKSVLVPGIEQMPYARYLKPLGRLVEKFGGTSGGLGTQPEPTIFTGADRTDIATVVCYESIYGEYITDFIKKGAELIFIITNDGWWRDTPGYRQHHQYARIRAIETRRSIARAANTGISSFITPKGQYFTQTEWWERTAIKQELPHNDEITFYTRNGDYLGRLAVFLLALLFFYMISQRIIKRKAG